MISAYEKRSETIRRINENMLKVEPEAFPTPWGIAYLDNVKMLGGSAILEVSTYAHGGLMIKEEIIYDIASEDEIEAIKTYCGGVGEYNGYICFEEDCAAPEFKRQYLDDWLSVKEYGLKSSVLATPKMPYEEKVNCGA